MQEAVVMVAVDGEDDWYGPHVKLSAWAAARITSTFPALGTVPRWISGTRHEEANLALALLVWP